MSGKISSPRGTFDVVYPDSAIRARVVDTTVKILRRYGYREIETPIFEQTDLFVRSIGSETDIVQKEMYTFEDRGGVSLTLRPEGTAPIVRAYLQRGLNKKGTPQKLFYRGPMLRRERPQAGRFRQFYQVGAEAIGSENPFLDVEMIEINAEFFSALGLSDYRLLLNSVGCSKCRSAYLDSLGSFLEDVEKDLCRDCQRRMVTNPLRVLDCKKEGCRQILKGAPALPDFLCDSCADHFSKVQEELGAMGIVYIIDPRLVRGLDYYTHTAFEFRVESLGAQDTVSAGGRYDELVEELGGPPTPGVGFSLGLERLVMALGPGNRESLMPERLDIFVASGSDSDRKEARRLLLRLRDAGFSSDIDFLQRSLKAQMRHANRLDSRLVIIVSGVEKSGTVTLREMDTSVQEEVSLQDLEDEIRKSLSAGE